MSRKRSLRVLSPRSPARRGIKTIPTLDRLVSRLDSWIDPGYVTHGRSVSTYVIDPVAGSFMRASVSAFRDLEHLLVHRCGREVEIALVSHSLGSFRPLGEHGS